MNNNTVKSVLEENILTKQKFSLMIEEIVRENPEIEYMDATCSLVEELGLDWSDVNLLLSNSLKTRIEDEANRNNLLKQTNYNVFL